MKLDTTSYYPASHLDDEADDNGQESVMPGSGFPEQSPSEPEEPPVQEPEDSGYENEPDRSQPPTTMERFADGVATFLSWTLVPLLMPVYGVLLAFNLSILHYTTFHVKLMFVLITTAITVAVPMLLVLLLKFLGVVKDLGLNGRKERLIPYIISILSMTGAGIFMYCKGAPFWLVMFFGGGAAAGMINLLINFRWKISAHAAGIAGVVALLIRINSDGYPVADTFAWLIIALVLTGLMGSARVWLGRHTVWQVLAGYAVGFLSVYFMTMIQFN